MAECVICRKTKGLLTSWHEDKCMECYISGRSKSSVQPFHEEIEAVVLTTEAAPSLNITKRIEIVTAECAFGMNIFKDLFAGVRDIVGGRSPEVYDYLQGHKTAQSSAIAQDYGTGVPPSIYKEDMDRLFATTEWGID